MYISKGSNTYVCECLCVCVCLCVRGGREDGEGGGGGVLRVFKTTNLLHVISANSHMKCQDSQEATFHTSQYVLGMSTTNHLFVDELHAAILQNK